MSKPVTKAAPVAPEKPAEEPRVYAVLVEKRGGGIALTEVEVPRSACKVLRAYAPDAADQAIGKLAAAVERRLLR